MLSDVPSLVKFVWLKWCTFHVQVFFFHGRLICGPDPKGLMLTTVSIFLSSWIFARYVGKNVPHHSAPVVTFGVMLTLTVGS